MKKRILIDIDVVAVAEHYVKDRDHKIAKLLMDRVKSGEFKIYATYSLLELVEKWQEKSIKEKILSIYYSYSYVIPAVEIEFKSREKGVVFEEIVKKLSKKDVKKEDAALAVIASLFGLVLVTLNRKHLRNRRDDINKILKESDLDEIKILLPNEF